MSGDRINPWAPGSPEHDEWHAIDRRLAALPPRPRADPAAVAAHEPVGLAHLALGGVLLFADTSTFSGAVDFARYKAGGFKVLGYKETEGRTYLDDQANASRHGIAANDLEGLAYHFAFWSTEYASNPKLWGAQVEWFLAHAPSGYAHCLDIEMLAASGSFIDVRAMVNAYRAHYATHPLLLYTNRGLWVNRSKVPYGAPAGTLLWHAGYRDGLYAPTRGTLAQQWSALGSTVNSMSGLGFTDDETLIYQFTDHASVPGIGSLCDGNAFRGTVADYRDSLITGGADDMSQADVDQIKAYIDSRIDDIAARVWAEQITRSWDGNQASAASTLASTQFYAIQGGFVGTTPSTATTGAGSTTVAAQLTAGVAKAVAQTDTLKASVAALPTGANIAGAVNAAVAANLDDIAVAVAARLTQGVTVNAGATPEQVRAALVDTLNAARLTTT